MGVMGQQNSCKTLIGVHNLTVYLMHKVLQLLHNRKLVATTLCTRDVMHLSLIHI